MPVTITMTKHYENLGNMLCSGGSLVPVKGRRMTEPSWEAFLTKGPRYVAVVLDICLVDENNNPSGQHDPTRNLAARTLYLIHNGFLKYEPDYVTEQV